MFHWIQGQPWIHQRLAVSPKEDKGSQTLKECCVHLHSNVQKWKEQSSKGFDLANQIANLGVEKKHVEGASHYGTLSPGLPLLSDMLCSKVVAQREDLFTQLKEVESNLMKIVDKLGSLVNNMKSSMELLLTKSLDPAMPPFATLPPAMFGVYSEEIYCAYCQEMSVKQHIVEDILHQRDRDTVTVYLSCWLHEPYLTSHVSECLEAMLLDCGLHS